METFNNIVAQGDMLIVRIDELPADVRKQEAENGEIVVTHSETGHNHVIKDTENVNMYEAANDNLKAYLVVDNEPVDLIHKRSYHTHETVRIKEGVYAIYRQRQHDVYGEIRAVLD